MPKHDKKTKSADKRQPGNENNGLATAQSDENRQAIEKTAIADAHTVASILVDIADGGTLNKTLVKHRLTNARFYTYIRENPEAADAYTRAREQGVEIMVSQIIEIADDSSVDAQQARNRIDARKWIAGRLLRHVYGDKLDVHVNKELDISAVLIAARARGEQAALPVQDADYVEIKTDCESVEKADAPG